MAGMKKKKEWFKELMGKLKRKPKPLFRNTSSVESPVEGGGNYQISSSNISWDSGDTVTVPSEYSNVKKDDRIEKKPVEVWGEIISEKPSMDLSQVETQIRTVERRKKILEEEIGITTTDEKVALAYLYARRKLKKLGRNEFLWQTTTNELIQKLKDKYRVQLVGLSSYYKCVPNEALEELEKFSKAWRKISDASPEIKLIIDEGGKEQKKDPIMVASSPFGNWWFVLGAWDKEVKYVDDIVYKGK